MSSGRPCDANAVARCVDAFCVCVCVVDDVVPNKKVCAICVVGVVVVVDVE